MENENKPSIIKPKTTELVVPEVFSISNVEYNMETLKANMAKDLTHIIKDINDKEGYKISLAKRAVYRTLRTSLVKLYKTTAKPYQDYVKGLKKAIDDLAAQAEKGEQFFQQQMDDIDAEKERLELEEKAAKQRIVFHRIADLMTLGATFDGLVYKYSYTPAYVLTALELSDYTSEGFNTYLDGVKEAWAEEQTRLHEQNIADGLAETNRLAEIEATRIQTEANQAKQTALRLKELKLLGGVQDGEIYKVKGSVIPLSTVLEYDTEEWEQLISVIENVEINNTEPLKSEIQAKRNIIVEPTVERPLTHAECFTAAVDDTELQDESLPLSTFYSAEVIDFGDKVTTIEQLLEWAEESLIDEVRDDTPHGKHGATENTQCFLFDGKYLEITIDNITYNRYDKQYYFIDMYEKANLFVKEVRLPQGTRPIMSVNSVLNFTQDTPCIDIQVSKKLTVRLYPLE